MSELPDQKLPSEIQSLLSQFGQTDFDDFCAHVKHIARGVCSGVVFGRERDDFVDGAMGLVLAEKRGKFDPTKGSLWSWLRIVLKNELINDGRRRVRCRAVGIDPASEQESATGDRSHAEGISELHAGLDRKAPFSAADMERIGRWGTRDRLRLLSMVGLSAKVPSELWAGWCEEEGVELPFPPAGLLEIEELKLRLDALASALGESYKALKMHWYRKKKHLELLDYIDGLKREADDER